MWFHPLFGVVVAALFLAMLVMYWQQVSLRSLSGRAVAIASITIFLNLPWLIAMAGSQNLAAQQPYQKSVGLWVLAKPLIGIWSGESMGSFLNPLFSAALLAGIVLLPKEKRLRAFPFMLAGALLLVFAAFGASHAALGGLQPNRFVAPAFLIIGVGAAFCLGEFVVWLRTTRGLRIKLMAGSVAVLVCAYVGRELIREVTPGPHGHYGKPTPEISEAPAIATQLESWIRENTTSDGRILFETSLSRIHGGGHIAGMLALRTRREFIGAPYPYSSPAVSFWDNVGFGKPIRDLGVDQFSVGLDLYNVGWIIAHSSSLIHLVNSLQNAQLAAEFGAIRIFKINRTLSYLQSGVGHVQAREFNHVVVADAAGPELILRYNWVAGLTTVPPARIEPVQVHPDFAPLIRVVSPPGRFVLTLRSGMQD
jgi:hypothetical protein